MKRHPRIAIWIARLRVALACCMLGFVTIAALPAPAYADQVDVKSTCDKYEGLINRFGSCIQDVVMQVASKFFTEMYLFFVGSLSAFLTLGVIIYGVMLSAGLVENIKRDSMVLLLKIVFVVFFAQNLEMMFLWIVDAMNGLIDLYFQFSSSFDEGKCALVGAGFSPFKRLDCLMDLVVGLKTSDYGGSYSEKVSGDSVERGLLNFFFKAGISTTLGIVISAIGFAMVYTLIFTVIKIVFFYLIALIGLTFMIMLGPIFIPLVIFKVTKGYFDKWLNIIVSFALQPVIMFAYVALMIIAFDKAIFSGSNSLVSAIAGPESQQPGFNLNEWLEQNQVFKREGRGGAQVKVDDPMKDTSCLESGDQTSATPSGIRRNDCGSEDSVKTYANSVPISMIDWKKLAEVRGMEEKELYNQVMLASIFVGLVMYVFSSMLRYIPSIATDVTGGSYDAANLWREIGGNPLSKMAGNLTGSLQQTVERLTARGAS